MANRARVVLSVVFVVTGFSALTLQVVWQRVISLHAGVDLVSFTTVVSAFLAGIGIGSLFGGALADRLGARGSVVAFAVSNTVIGVFAWLSIWLFYDVYRAQAEALTTTWAKFGFNFTLVVIPATLMGLSLPLVARGVVERVADAGPIIGRLYGLNTLGAAFGAAASGWYIVGTLGFVGTTRLAGSLNLLAAVLVVLVARSLVDAPVADADGDEPEAVATSSAREPLGEVADAAEREVPTWVWYVVYALTGAVALGLETVFFRLVDSVMRSNSYSFAHVLSVYLALFGIGSALAAPVVRRVRRPGVWFLWIQFGVGVSAMAGLVMLTKGLYRLGFDEALTTYFKGEGFSIGFRTMTGERNTAVLPVFVGAPLLLMGLPVLGMGAAFPFVQSLVARRMETLGRHTGRLVFANVVGNVAGSLLASFVLVDRLGTAGTYRVLGALLIIPGLVAAWLATTKGRRIGLALAALLVGLVFVRFLPTNQFLWSRLHGVELAGVDVAEDRSCANALRHLPDGQFEMTVNGASQNNYPFDEFHTLIGLAPAVMSDQPRDTMALGLGIGATPYGLSLDPRVEQVHAVEICGGQVPLLLGLADRGAPELQSFFADQRVEVVVGDGRDYLLRSGRQFDVVVVDTLRQQAAFSGNLYSQEFYELVRDHLAPGGLLAQWAPSTRTLNSVTEVFPYVVRLWVPSYFTSAFFVASTEPIEWDAEEIARRAADAKVTERLPAREAALIEEFFRTAQPECIVRGEPKPLVPDDARNHDLFPRDEYFLNNTDQVPARATCG